MHKIIADIDQNPLTKIKLRNAFYPIIIGLGVVGYLFYREFNPSAFDVITFSKWSIFWLIIAFCFMGLRDFGYMLRLRVLTDSMLSLRQSFRVIMLWEFTSAITPSTVGGTAVAVVFLHKEGMTVGRSTAVVLATSFLDELYFVVMLPLLVLLVGGTTLFTTSFQGTGISFLNELVLIAGIGYTVILIWVILVGYGLFFNPEGIRKLIIKIFSFPFLKRWHEAASSAGDDIVKSSHELREKSFSFWFKAVIATFLSWTSRYWVVNAILMAFFSISEHFLIFDILKMNHAHSIFPKYFS